MKGRFLVVLLVGCCAHHHTGAQDTAFIRNEIARLSAAGMSGRGYVNKGAHKAARYLSARFRELGLQPVNGGQEQTFSFSVNTFPSRMALRIGDRQLKPGEDFLIHPASKGIELKSKKISTIDFASLDFTDTAKQWKKLRKRLAKKNRLYLLHNIDTLTGKMHWGKTNATLARLPQGAFLLPTQGKPTWSVAPYPFEATVVKIYKLPAAQRHQSKASINVDQRLDAQHQAKNIVGMIPGTEVPDSFIVLTAHYDHLGKMGAGTVFPGASDNASGTALLLSLAHSLAKFPQRYSLLFIAFAGEEVGLLGSKYFTENPLVDLKKIRFLLNLDILGDAAEGITVVNGEEFKQEFALLQLLNHQLPESIIRPQASTLLSLQEEGAAQSGEPADNSNAALTAGELKVPSDEEQLLAHYPEDTASTDFPIRARVYPPSVTSSWKSLPFIIARGPAANSDHYYFYLKGVPCFFIYSNGGPGYYHDIWDKPGTLSLTNIDHVQALIERFIISLQNTPSSEPESIIFEQ